LQTICSSHQTDNHTNTSSLNCQSTEGNKFCHKILEENLNYPVVPVSFQSMLFSNENMVTCTPAAEKNQESSMHG